MPQLNNLLVIYDIEASLELAYITQPLPFDLQLKPGSLRLWHASHQMSPVLWQSRNWSLHLSLSVLTCRICVAWFESFHCLLSPCVTHAFHWRGCCVDCNVWLARLRLFVGATIVVISLRIPFLMDDMSCSWWKNSKALLFYTIDNRLYAYYPTHNHFGITGNKTNIKLYVQRNCDKQTI